MTISVIGNKVLISVDVPEKETSGGIILAAASQSLPNRGTVVAVGKGRVTADGMTIPMTVEVGDKVMFQFGNEASVTVNDEDFIVITEDEILAVLGE